MRPIRNSAKAIILHEGRILLTKNEDEWGIFYLLPGGGQEKGEDLHTALQRECREEIACEVQIGPLRYIREYIGKHHEFKNIDMDIHQVEFMFVCALAPDQTPHNGAVPDSAQIGVEWVDVKSVKDIRLYPGALKAVFSDTGELCGGVYLGDVN